MLNNFHNRRIRTTRISTKCVQRTLLMQRQLLVSRTEIHDATFADELHAGWWCARAQRAATRTTALASGRPSVIRSETGRQIIDARAPSAFLVTQSEYKLFALSEERVVNPVLRVRLSVQGRVLNKDILVAGIKVNVPDDSSSVRRRVGDVDALEEGRGDEVHILSRHDRKAHHAECNIGTQSSRIIVTRQTIVSDAEGAWDVVVNAASRLRGPASIVELIDGEERRLVADIGDVLVVEVIQTSNVFGRSTKGTDQGCLVVGDVEHVLPNA